MKYKQHTKAVLLLADGTIFEGRSIGMNGTAFGEICFNTGVTGYQEVFTDPSYFGQILLTTNAHIGNYGVNNDESESDSVKIAGLVCKNFSYSNSRDDSDDSLENYLKNQQVMAIENVDTRAVVRYIRDKGAMNAVISTETDIQKLKEELKNVPSMEGLELASKVSTKKTYFFGNKNAAYKIAALDIGIKKSILKNLATRDCYIKVFPYNATFKELESFKPDGYFLSNGPGDPTPLKEAQKLTREIIKRNLPLFGICLGHQIIALANGISTYKMHNGHRGINHPVQNLSTGKGEITSQNHGFVVNKEEVENNKDFEITHIHLNDNTLSGMKMKHKNCFSVQYHPEANPGPHDSSYLFDQFIENITAFKNSK
ncbi:glutamine-hydrolyzing carbamoyl-phosphate synthase small subunit [Lutibacter sp.]|uniref:glutamine-hydrolyzing carbamoyl-phosphate synthase small subunit n=1 Tax=Lutibacter sp. TaxID=1925666 RepID=UPI0025C63D52|nr:glutamine-hydrolyzing carbamoyl-phosphate synthase small subunit [Lutibacter sp.]MCF6180827.1 glutamine-hydrolyzing carbamoyl-phosphate synthase small subunit [Lutibacter sp.]